MLLYYNKSQAAPKAVSYTHLLSVNVIIHLEVKLNCKKILKNEGRGLSYPPCLLMKPVLHLRLYATQSQPCFPAASNALALPGGNGIFTATPTERITHYTLQARSCANGGVAPFGFPHKKRRYATPPRGAYRLFLLSSRPAVSQSKVSVSCGVVSLSK